MTDTRRGEAEIERRSRVYAKNRGCMLLKFTSPGNAGVPDRILIVPSKLRVCMRPAIAFIEFKREGRKPTKLQRWWIEELRSTGARATWFDSYEAFIVYLDRLIDVE